MNCDADVTRRSVLASVFAAGLTGLSSSTFSSSTRSDHQISGLVKRSDFVFPEKMIYLNTASVGPSPRSILERMIETWDLIESSPVAESYSRGTERLEKVREQIASFINCEKQDIVFTSCTSDAMARLSFALDLKPGDHVISTDQEHEGGHDCWIFHAKSRGVEVEDIKIDLDERNQEVIVDKIAKAIKPNTRVISFSHVLYTNGMRLPAKEICEFARKKNIVTIIDGAQALGNTVVDVATIGCDAYAAPGHKWLLGPKGTGFMYVRRSEDLKLKLLSRMTDTQAQNDTTGLANHMSLQGLSAAIEYVNRIGLDRIVSHCAQMHAYAYDKLQSLPVSIFSSRDGESAAPLLSFKIDSKHDIPKLIPTLLTEENLVIKGLRKLSALRISTHMFNTEADIDRAVAILKRRLS